jgi:hypothetical protein
LYRDPDHPELDGESSIQFMSTDQDPEDMASDEFPIVMHDEAPKLAQWRESEARVMAVGGRITLAMTWPDDATINCEWIHDEVLERAGDPDSGVEIALLDTTENKSIDQDAIAIKARGWDEETRNVRLRGGHVRFSNLVHPLFTDRDSLWCFGCNKTTLGSGGYCGRCGATGTLTHFNHVGEFDHDPWWPVVMLIDPHPRKDHCLIWIAADPNDDHHVLAEAEVDGDPTVCYERSREIESALSLNIVRRVIDPRMGRSPSSTDRSTTWQDSFDEAGLRCDTAPIVEMGVAHKGLNVWLAPDRDTKRPRLRVHSRCERTIFQMKRFCWDDWKKGADKGQKQKIKEKHDDFPGLLRYYWDLDPTFDSLDAGFEVLHTRKPTNPRRAA